ncbi:MAG: dehypoxanthine futalosine cyclase [Phycisphaerae bacterium]|nr:dehypoxanthine futalosine cyclase [Phycisphaerae bacterium]
MTNRLTAADARNLLRNASIHELGRAAHAVTLRLHPEPVRTYVVDRNINYSNVCAANCAFCNFKVAPGDPAGYLLSMDALLAKIGELVAIGGTQVLLQGGLHPLLPLEWFEDLFRTIKSHYPAIHLHALSPPEIAHLSRLSGLPMRDVLLRLRAAGLDSLPGGGAEILVDRVRKRLSPGKCLTADWLEAMRQTHGIGLVTSATMMFGHVETDEERIEHLERIRELQDETHGFIAFIPWTFQHENAPLTKASPNDLRLASAYDYLRMLAVSRLFLDNVPNVQASWVTQGAKIGQLALFFGANDMGSVMMEENVVSSAGTIHHLDEVGLRHLIRAAGFTPHRRNQRYELIEETGVAAVAERRKD